MNQKKTGLFFVFFIIGGAIFWLLSAATGYISLFFPLFFIAYAIILVLIMRNYSNKKVIILVSLFVIYLFINTIQFPPCNSASFFSREEKTCTCIGIQKHSFGVIDSSRSECVGVSINKKCFEHNLINGAKTEISCEK